MKLENIKSYWDIIPLEIQTKIYSSFSPQPFLDELKKSTKWVRNELDTFYEKDKATTLDIDLWNRSLGYNKCFMYNRKFKEWYFCVFHRW